MSTVTKILKTVSIFAITTGLGDVFFGNKLVEFLAAEPFVIDSLAVGLADNQIRFLGAAWAAYGGIMWWASDNLRTRRTPLAILGAAFFLGGVGRSLSVLSTGYWNPTIASFIAVELLGPIYIYLAFPRGSAAS